MATGEVIPTPGGDMPFKVVMRHDDGSVMAEMPVASLQEGEAFIAEALRDLQDKAKEGGHL
ncbi:hypothetical protein [Methylobacterium sp. yr668]|uniref:hypothetical protein n=1 Tax=Methylobacterium sp. yr668 TaxID=1761801 RepID=UPI0008EEB002|nr:hypothetical protein [Methylobacterium sp. yr668]SFT11590.1 hypothetical protein SAMN04487845_1177 [Methylobacterium sp. yr668]